MTGCWQCDNSRIAEKRRKNLEHGFWELPWSWVFFCFFFLSFFVYMQKPCVWASSCKQHIEGVSANPRLYVCALTHGRKTACVTLICLRLLKPRGRRASWQNAASYAAWAILWLSSGLWCLKPWNWHLEVIRVTNRQESTKREHVYCL